MRVDLIPKSLSGFLFQGDVFLQHVLLLLLHYVFLGLLKRLNNKVASLGLLASKQ
jgi:hypothetical protein